MNPGKVFLNDEEYNELIDKISSNLLYFKFSLIKINLQNKNSY